MKAKITWLVLAVLYACFFSWYTSCGGPLSSEEVTEAMARIRNRPDVDAEFVTMMQEFLEADTGDDFVMINVIEMYETPLQIEGVEPGETSEEVLAKYMQFMTPELFKRACHPVFYGLAAAGAIEMFGIDGVRNWTVGAGMRYRSRRDLLEIASNPAFQGSHQFKIAAMRKTFAFPVDPWFHLGDPRLVLAMLFLILGLTVSWLGARSARA